MRVLAKVLMMALLGASATASVSVKGTSPLGRNTGVGVLAGEPSGVTGKFWFRDREAMQGLIGYSFDHYFVITADYVYHFPQGTAFVPYVGAGAAFYVSATDDRATNNVLKFYKERSGNAGFALRVPVGVEWFVAHPISVMIELAPSLGLIPNRFGILDGGIGARVYF